VTEPAEPPPPRRTPLTLLRRHERRSRLLPRAFLVGLVAGAIAVAFRVVLEAIETARPRVVDWAHAHGFFGFAALVGLSAAAAGLAVLLVRRFSPDAAGSGIPHLQGVLHHWLPLRAGRLIPVKFLGGIVGIGGGLALGREGPTVQMGGATGELVGRLTKGTPRERLALVCAGAGAGLAAAFNAPLAGVLFVLEELRRQFAPGLLAAAFVASVTADFVTRLLSGQTPAFHLRELPPLPDLSALPLFVVLGALCGLLGVAFNRSILGMQRLFDRPALARRIAPVLAVGALVGVAAWIDPRWVGGGGPLVATTFGGALAYRSLALFFVARLLLSSASYATGAAGGIFAPMLVLGALAGHAIGRFGGALPLFSSVTPAAGAVVGMAALFTAVVRAPVTGTVLILEMTESYSLLLPVIAASLAAYGVAELLRERPVYEALLERQLLRAGVERAELEEPLLIDLDVAPGSHFDGLRVDELALPRGCLLVQIRRGLRIEVPHRETVLQANDRISALVQPGSGDALSKLRLGIAPPVPESD
jgi:CIC family chloride channel protein